MLEQNNTKVYKNIQINTKEEHFTITDFSKLAGVTRKTIYNLLNSDLKPYIFKGAKKTLINKNALYLFGKSPDDIQNNKINELKKEIFNKDDEIQYLKLQIEEIQKNKVIDIDNLSNEIKRLESRIKTLEEQLKTKEDVIIKKDKHIEEQQKNVTRRDGIIAALNTKLADQTSKIAFLENRGLWARIVNKKQNKKLLE